MPVFLSIGTGFKYAILKFSSCAVGGRLFTRLWPRIISCPFFSRLGPALKYIKCCLEVSCAVGGRLFTRLWPRKISYVDIFVGWGGFKICCL